ncbi:PAS domain S-box-containing protein [Mucilaginibacter gracilis]|uniref:histidine kinase n=1 Tax=Mucilaginibacter gracilis TaxID=423350 RepID=A0A495J888_9SPHI|nr:ATP-binding protein [Mucilaginibacter gracilis]RKR84742.1 PAS domain S-box-containing protein [Mucilaginibacter gracilis]
MTLTEKSLMPFESQLKEASDKFDTIFNLTSAASKILNADLTIIKVNQALIELLGFPAAEIEGTKIMEYVCAEYRGQWHDLQEALWHKELPFFKLEACLVKKNRSLVWVHVTTVLYHEGNETFGFTVLDDFTSQKNLEDSEKQLKTALGNSRKIKETLRHNERHLSQILETMAEGVCIVNKAGKLTYTNPMAQKIFGLDQAGMLARNYNDDKWHNLRLDGSPLPHEEHPMMIMMASGKPVFDEEIAIQPRNGERFYISFNAAPIFDDDGIITEGVGTFMDVTQRRKLIQHKDEFISVASHELKTPVTSLKLALQLLSRMKDNPSPLKLPQLIDQANKSLDKLSVLVADLLNVSKVNEGQLELNKTWFNISTVVNDCCYHIRAAGDYTINTTGDMDLQVLADVDRIDQVITNFVNNAVKYASESKTIAVHISKHADTAKVSVSDEGPGIPIAKVPHLFDRYYQADASSNQISGLGLGLYIAAEIIKKHGGQIGVESELGKGSSFWFTLPVSLAACC